MSAVFSRQALFVVGLALGLLLGLVYTWGISPVEFYDTRPALLRADYRWTWVRMAALSYVADGNLARARARLEGLEQRDVSGALEALIEEYHAAGRPADTLRSLATLVRALGVEVESPALLIYLNTPAAPLPTRTPTPTLPPTFTPTSTPASAPTSIPTAAPTFTLTPTPELTGTIPILTPTPTPPLPHRLQLSRQEQICEPGQAPRIEVIVKDERGAQVAGIEVWLMWSGGADRAVTGLKPRGGTGYVDFDVEPGVEYSLGTSELGMPLVTGLRIEPCPAEEDREPVMGSWRIELSPRPPATSTPEGG